MMPIDQLARTTALDPFTSFIVQAPAGSGKTELLTQRFLCLLAHTPHSPEEIVAITFTKKAAAEMRERILSALQLANEDEPETAHQQQTWRLARKALQRDKAMNWNILENPNRLRIMTIDALSFHINQMAPLLGELGCQPEIIDKPHTLYRAAAIHILTAAEHSGIEAAVKKLLLHLDNRVEYFIDLLVHMLQKREQWLPHTIHNFNDADTLKQQLEQSLQQLAIDTLQQFEQDFDPSIRHQFVILAAEAGRHLASEDPHNEYAMLAEIDSSTPVDIEHIALWQKSAALLLTKTKSWRKKVTKAQGFPAKSKHKQLLEELLPAIHEQPNSLQLFTQLTQLPPTEYTPNQWSILQALMQILPVLVAHLRIIMQSAGSIDFTEITLSALRALGDSEHPTDLALYLDHQIQHLLIDEFQDTSSVQFKLFEKLVASWGQGEQQSIFLVGDPMQSIYRFRNAEVSLFLQAKHHGIGPLDLKFLELQTNFRSQAKIVDWINNTFTHIMPEFEDTKTGAIPYSPAVAMQSATDHTIHYHASAKGSSNPHQFIVDLTHSIPTDESIAILVRSRSQLKQIIPTLHEHNISFNAIDIEPLANTAEIQDCLALTSALLHRQDDIAWLSILRAPWCGLTLAEIHSIYTNKEHSYFYTIEKILASSLNADYRQRLTHLYSAVNDALSNWGRKPSASLIEDCWHALNGPACLDSLQAQQNCERFFNLLLKLETEDGTIDRERLQQAVADLYSSASSADAKIQIMTIHKSKGLEFDHVILPELQKKSTADASQLLQWLERPNSLGEIDLLLAPISAYGQQQENIYQYLQQTEKDKLTFESARLLYVACTRAKQSLHLAFQYQLKHDDDPSSVNITSGSHLRLLWNSQQQHWLQLIEPVAITDAKKNIVDPVLERLSLSQLQPSARITHAIIQQKEQSELDYCLALTAEHPRITGEIIHYELQLITEIGIQAWQSQSRNSIWQRQLQQQAVTQPLIQQQCLDKISLAVSNTINCDQGKWLLSNEHEFCQSEYAISYVEHEQIKHCIIDRLIIDSEYAWIIDYKTAQPETQEDAAWFAHEYALYQQQINSYATTIARLYPQHTVRGVLYFPLCSNRWHEILDQQPA